MNLYLSDLTGSVGLFIYGQVILWIEMYSPALETEENNLA